MSKTSKEVQNDKLELYEKLIATHPDIERKGKTMPYTSHNGHMFTLLAKSESLGIRLPKEHREAFLEKYKTTLFEQYGAIMKEYVTVPAELLKNTDELKQYLELSYEYVKTLKPKPSKKKS
ncbi:MAG: TfoX/Sxy family protein [Candidatus Thorarchaeota archaeon]|jgi:TfoX/Sxy family transcriptional regulator of competence genes